MLRARTALPRPPLVLGALALCASVPAAFAFTLGNIQVRSALDEPLDARIPVSASAGDGLAGACFTLAPPGVPGAPRLRGASLGLRRSAKGAYLQVRTREPVRESAQLVAIAIACKGQPPQETRRYSVLLDPRGKIAVPVVGMSLTARPGDTLQSVASAIFRRNRAARRDYLEAIRAANPALASLADGDPIAAGSAIALPDLRTFARSRHAAAAPQVPGPVAQASAPPAVSPPKPRAARASALTGHPPAPAPHRKVTSPPPPVHAAPVAGFQLKLSAPVVDLSPSRAIDDRTRAQLRERLAVLDADDQVAAMLSMRNSLRQLEAEVQQLRLKLAGMPSSLASAPPAPAQHVAPPAPVPQPEARPVVPTKVAPAPVPQPEARPVVPTKVAPAPQPRPVDSNTTPSPAPGSIAEPAPAPPPAAATTPVKAPVQAAVKPPAATQPPTPAAAKTAVAAPWYDSYELWAGIAAALVLVAGAAAYLWRRRRAATVPEEDWQELAPEAPWTSPPSARHPTGSWSSHPKVRGRRRTRMRSSRRAFPRRMPTTCASATWRSASPRPSTAPSRSRTRTRS